ncbi:phosphatase PAP2 family protein [Oleiharenicola lentus]|uniref:phosphatase PAP2 family protein n=1 Tax=Oleiharenicola lentus TaxID=2508720 RepID=UPI003F67E100
MVERFKAWWRRAGWNEYVLVAGFATFALAIWIFAELADDAVEGDYLEWEQKIMLALRGGGGEQPAWLVHSVRDITALGSAPVLILVVALVLGFLVLQRRLGAVMFVLAATLGGHGLNIALKNIFGRARPDPALHLMEETSYSFPSGHSMASSIVYLTIGMAIASWAERRRDKSYIIATAFLLSFLIGVSRVYLGVHYPTDVLAGWTAGTAWALFCSYLAYRFK